MDGRRPWQLRKGLWKAGGLLAAYILTLIVANFFMPSDKAYDSHMYGHDFLPFYTAGQFIRSGHIDQIYDPQATKTSEHQTCQTAGLVIHNEYGAFLNPPFVALAAAPLARLPYRAALGIWTIFLLLCLGGSILLLMKLLPPRTTWTTWGLIPLLLFGALPAWQAMLHAQNTFFSLLLLVGAVTLWRNDRSFAAGLVAGLLLFKPQIGFVVAIALVVAQGRRAAAGVLTTAMILLAITLIAMPASLENYLSHMGENLRAMQALPNYVWNRHVTFLAWWRLLLQGHVGALPGDTARRWAWRCLKLLAGFVATVVWYCRCNALRRDRLIAATIAAMPLLMPYYMDYDLTLLAVAAVLCGADAMRYGVDPTIATAWVIFYVVMEFNSSFAGVYRVIPVVPALLILAACLLIHAIKPLVTIRSSQAIEPPSTPLSRALAA